MNDLSICLQGSAVNVFGDGVMATEGFYYTALKEANDA